MWWSDQEIGGWSDGMRRPGFQKSAAFSSPSRLTVLITGAAGFIGSNLADRLLVKGYRVIGIDNLSFGSLEQVPEAVEFHKLDIRDNSIYPLFQGSDYVFHLAAKNCISDCQSDPVETADINVRGTVNVFEAASRAKVKKVIYAESSSLYEGSKTLPTPETEINPVSFYAISKFSSMYFAEGYSRFFGLATTALRYFCVYGPRQDYRRTIPPVFSAFIIKLLRGERPVIYGTGEKRRDFIHVDDVNDFHELCITDPRTTSKVFNLGSGSNLSVNEIFSIIASLLGSQMKPIYQGDLPGEAVANLADITEARKLGWEPKVDLKTGLATSIDYIRKELAKGNIQ
ncbi:MAG TPA: NAD-dependent epimerase/dehydratase family protein [Candidatus Acidoferrales bacterium]|nr:NAD-dependent epimerase/dehydratase family protein [Candidatus Acidoferrales bacterium]